MSNKVLQLQGCEMKGSTFQSRKFNFLDRDISADTFYFRVLNSFYSRTKEINGQTINNDVIFDFTELENLSIGRYFIEYWAVLDGIGTEIIAYENFIISNKPCEVDYSKDDSFTLNLVNETINYSLNISVINIGTGGGTGIDGKSAYQSYLDTTSDNPKKTEAEWSDIKDGKDFEYSDFTPEQIEALKVKGDPLTFEDLTASQKLELTGPKGADGTGVKISTWSASSYGSGVQLFKDGKIYESNSATTSTDIPGVSPKWDLKIDNVSNKINDITILKSSSNLISKSDIIINSSYNNVTGSVTTFAGRGRTNKIEVTPSSEYIVRGANPNGINTFALFWDISNVYLGYVSFTNDTAFTTDANAYYMALNYANKDASLFIDTLQINKGNVLLPYEDYYKDRAYINPTALPEGSGGGGGTAYNQSLNTSDSVEFASLKIGALVLDLPISNTGLSSGEAWIDTANGNVIKIVI